MHKFCANEQDYHQFVINNLNKFPDALKSRPGLHLLAWGHELDLHDAGRGGGDGAADILTVDEEGMVWLIEAKFGNTSERGKFVWGSQLRRYKGAIARMKWQDILPYSARFLRGLEKVKPSINFPTKVQTFSNILELWQNSIGKQSVEPNVLNDMVAVALESGKYGLMIMTDFYDKSYVTHGETFSHDGPLAYVRADVLRDGMRFEVVWQRPASGGILPDEKLQNYSSNLEVPKLRCDPETFATTLCPGARDLWEDVLKPGLEQLGVKKWHRKQMSFDVNFEINGKLLRLLIVGWPERDAKNVPREYKLHGAASLRINPDIKRIYLTCEKNVDLTNGHLEEPADFGVSMPVL